MAQKLLLRKRIRKEKSYVLTSVKFYYIINSLRDRGSTKPAKENTIKEMKVDPQIFENKFRNENTGS